MTPELCGRSVGRPRRRPSASAHHHSRSSSGVRRSSTNERTRAMSMSTSTSLGVRSSTRSSSSSSSKGERRARGRATTGARARERTVGAKASTLECDALMTIANASANASEGVSPFAGAVDVAALMVLAYFAKLGNEKAARESATKANAGRGKTNGKKK